MLTEPILKEEEETNLLYEKSYRIIFYNDNEIPYQAVVITLQEAFDLTIDDVIKKIITAEQKGKATAKGGYSFNEASEKLKEAKNIFKEIWSGKQLKMDIEEE